MAKYDILSGGLKTLKQDLNKNIEKLKKIDKELNLEIANELIRRIQQEANSIDYNYQMYSAVYNGNEIEETTKGYRVVNRTQHATYSEYGTGMIGQQNPHPNNALGWQYDVNQHGEKGWRYVLDGKFWFTRGVISNPVYLRSAELVRQDLPNIVKRKLGELNE